MEDVCERGSHNDVQELAKGKLVDEILTTRRIQTLKIASRPSALRQTHLQFPTMSKTFANPPIYTGRPIYPVKSAEVRCVYVYTGIYIYLLIYIYVYIYL